MVNHGTHIGAASRLLALATVLGLLAACAQPGAINASATGPITNLKNIKVDNVEYATPAAALAAEHRTTERIVEEIAPEADPIKGTVRVIVPDTDRLRPLLSQTTLQLLKRPVTGEALDFFIEQQRIYNTTAANALLKTRAFEAGIFVEQNDVNDPPQGNDDYVVWYQVRTLLPNNTGAWIGHWLVRRRGSVAVQQATFDMGTAVGVPRYTSFVISVRQAALRLGGVSLAGVTSSSLPAGAASQGSIGSGIVIDTKGHVITNEHVVRACPRPTVMDSEGHSYEAEVTARDAANDLALLSTTHHWAEPATLRDGHEPRPGDGVVVTGYPLGGALGSGMIVTTGSLSALSGLHDDSRLLQVSAPVQPGNSGGPVLDESGHLLGMVSGSLNGMAVAVVTGLLPQNVNFAVKTTIIHNFLDTHTIAYAHAAPGHDLQPGEVGELARKFTVRVECRKP
jgi:S1-C subfamily serine protease